jgi:DNA-binding transcriptional LysR family regulator
VFSSVEIRHLHAVIALAEDLNFTRAAQRLRIAQPALSKLITDLEDEHRFHLFIRDKRGIVEVTDAGRVFVEEARLALFHVERAVHLARAAHEGSDSVLTIGHSPYANRDWISELLAIRLPLYPRLQVRLKTQFAMESVRSVLVGEVNLALVTAPPPDSQITAVPFAPAPLYVALPETHPAAPRPYQSSKDEAKALPCAIKNRRNMRMAQILFLVDAHPECRLLLNTNWRRFRASYIRGSSPSSVRKARSSNL